jgi:glycosyltransferase involved in cell wall biosynthesis
MKVLHICSDFSKQSIYNQMITNLSTMGIGQEVYVPVRTSLEIGKNQNKELKNVNYNYSFILNKTDRFFYHKKIEKIEKNLESVINVKENNIIHAHFLFSDGGVAYKLHKKYDIPYIVAVRNTDINVFFKYFLHLRGYALEILKNASQIVFLSPKYKEYTFEKYIPKEYHDDFLKKTSVVPNGVNPFWLNNIYQKKPFFNKDVIKFLYVGDFTKNKNIQMSISALNKLCINGKKIEFTLVGGGGNYDATIRKFVRNNSNWITLFDRTNNIQELKAIYESCDVFLMPSKYETFGLVYVEAMSQGLPIIFSQGQGVDGFFQYGEVGFSVKYNNIRDLVDKINLIVANYDVMSANCNKQAKEFSWLNISNKYIYIYSQFSNQPK